VVAETGVPVSASVARDHPSYSARCDDLGAPQPGFLCVPFKRPTLHGALTVAGRSRPFGADDLAILASLACQGAIAVENARAGEEDRNFFTHASDTLVSLLDSHDVQFHGHSRAVAALADMVSRRLGLPEEQRRTIHFAALLHDVGKLRLGPALLAQAGPLSPADRDLLRRHPALGVEVLRPISRWRDLAPIIHSHHERWDGRGYPRGLAGEAIPLGGRIVAIAEAFEAMVRPTPYREPLTAGEALAEVTAMGGSQFDPEIARLFVAEYAANQDVLGDRER
jgi:putative nucleotidyltransferase with HDIG domain